MILTSPDPVITLPVMSAEKEGRRVGSLGADASEAQSDKVIAKAKEAIEALGKSDRARAEMCFTQAVSYVEDIEDPAARRRAGGLLSVRLLRYGFHEPALQLARDAIQIDEQLKDHRHLAEDLISYGWSLLQAGQEAKAAEVFHQVLDLCKQHHFYATAASASTNLGALRFNQGQYVQAESLFQQSLKFLKQESFPDTEIRTHIFLVRTWHQLGKPSAQVLDLARDALRRLEKKMTPDHRNMMIGALEAPLTRFFEANPAVNSRQWLQANFPTLNPK